MNGTTATTTGTAHLPSVPGAGLKVEQVRSEVGAKGAVTSAGAARQLGDQTTTTTTRGGGDGRPEHQLVSKIVEGQLCHQQRIRLGEILCPRGNGPAHQLDKPVASPKVINLVCA